MGGTSGVKHDRGKPEWAYLPWAALEQVVKVQDYGAAKYSRENWKQVENLETRYLSAALRHITAHARGENEDPESGLPHLAHAITSLLFVLEDKLDTQAERVYDVSTFSERDLKVRV